MNKKIGKYTFIIFLITIFITTPLWSGVMAKPRRVNLLKTEHFDILFSAPSINNAVYLAENIDDLYEKAKSHFPEIKKDLRIPVIITPDSDRLSVSYTSSPYNRIVFFEGVGEKEDNLFEDTILSLFYHEIYLALSQSVRSPFNQFIHDTIGGNAYQPISLVYLPFSFVEGRSFIAESEQIVGTNEEEKEEYTLGRFNDKRFLEILTIAKYYDQFPNYLQASTSRDIYPGRLLNEAAGSAFSAFLMQSYGIEKYVEFWNICGNVNFMLTNGIFYKVYEKSLGELWKEFYASIPLPDNIEEMENREKNATSLFPYDTEGLAQNILVTDYGLVWYDGIRHEVDIYDWNNPLKIKQLLFLASNVKKLSLSPDGRYMVVSFYGIKTKEEFRNDKAWVYDLKERRKLKFTFLLREGEIVRLPDNSYGFAGINVKEKIPLLQVYKIDYQKEETTLFYEKEFPLYYYPHSITYGGRGKINYLVQHNNETTFYNLNLETKTEKLWDFSYKGKNINIDNIKAIPPSKQKATNKEHFYYVFDYFCEDEPSFKRMGLLKLNKEYEPIDIFFQNLDLPGGVNYPYVIEDKIYYVANRFDHSDIMTIPLTSLNFSEGSVIADKIITSVDRRERKEEDVKTLLEVDSEENIEEKKEKDERSETVAEENNTEESKKEDLEESTEEKSEEKEKDEKNKINIIPKEENTNYVDGYRKERVDASFVDKNLIQSGEDFYNIEKYHPFKYLFNYSVKPFLSLKELPTFEKSVEWPSLGAIITTQDDPFMNNKIKISLGAAFAPLDFQKIINPSIDDINEKKLRHVDDKKNFSAALSLYNTSTPIDILGGVLFKANKEGEYLFTTNINTRWPISLGMAFSNIDLTMKGVYTASTDYYDISLRDKMPSIPGFPKFSDAYETGQLSLGAEYNNIHQCGISPYEERGFKFGMSFDSFWDIFELRLLHEYVEKQEAEQNERLTPAQKKKLYSENRFDLSLLNIGFYTDIKIPRLTPFNMHKGLVLSMPSSLYFELLRKNGTALHLRTETLLLGYEIQNGIPPLYLFFSRLGIKAGYDFQLRYDTHKVPLPDIRKKNNLYNVFSSSYIRDSIFLIFDMNFCSSIGRMSEYHVNMSLKAEYFIRSESFAFRVKFSISL